MKATSTRQEPVPPCAVYRAGIGHEDPKIFHIRQAVHEVCRVVEELVAKAILHNSATLLAFCPAAPLPEERDRQRWAAGKMWLNAELRVSGRTFA